MVTILRHRYSARESDRIDLEREIDRLEYRLGRLYKGNGAWETPSAGDHRAAEQLEDDRRALAEIVKPKR